MHVRSSFCKYFIFVSENSLMSDFLYCIISDVKYNFTYLLSYLVTYLLTPPPRVGDFPEILSILFPEVWLRQLLLWSFPASTAFAGKHDFLRKQMLFDYNVHSRVVPSIVENYHAHTISIESPAHIHMYALHPKAKASDTKDTKDITSCYKETISGLGEKT